MLFRFCIQLLHGPLQPLNIIVKGEGKPLQAAALKALKIMISTRDIPVCNGCAHRRHALGVKQITQDHSHRLIIVKGSPVL
ncbi:hypothetical protein SDC9_174971 [bioreactor metagenome]|uniref:Uncharacterized protein n=1 Tax=bioreactor metagenome TaxID=1076179 RepID=A0A645GKX1_9ZZZZ